VAGSTTNVAVKGAALRRAGVLAGLLAGPILLVSVGLNTWAGVGYLHQLAWEFVGGEQVPWPSSLAGGPYGWAQLATFVITGLLIVVLAVALRDQLPRRRARSFAVVLLAPVGGGAAARRVQGRYADAQRRESQDLERVGARDRVLVDHCGRVVAPLTMALAVGGDAAGCRPIAVVSLAASALFVVSCSCPG
jgi:hypothetical protein